MSCDSYCRADVTGESRPGGEAVLLRSPDGGMRLDYFLAQELGQGRAHARQLILDGLVQIGGEPALRPAAVVPRDLDIRVAPRAKTASPVPLASPRVLYDDRFLVVVEKPAGVVVHPAPGHHGPTLVDALGRIGGAWSSRGGDERPGIVHRLDKGTSGLLALARTDQAHESLARQLRERTMGREYWALVSGGFTEERGRVDAAVGRDAKRPGRMAVTAEGRASSTEFYVTERLPEHTALRLRLLSGRTHQIRVHLAYIGRPIVGDGLYSAHAASATRPALHAAMLHLRHPESGAEMVFCSPLPADLQQLRDQLGGVGAVVWPWQELEDAVW